MGNFGHGSIFLACSQTASKDCGCWLRRYAYGWSAGIMSLSGGSTSRPQKRHTFASFLMNSAQCGHCRFPCALSEAFSPASFGARTIAIGSATMKSNAPNIHQPANPCPFLLAMDAGISPMTTAITTTVRATFPPPVYARHPSTQGTGLSRPECHIGGHGLFGQGGSAPEAEPSRVHTEHGIQCPNCGGTEFSQKRSKKGKTLWVVAAPLVLLAPKSQVRCSTCGTMFKRG